MGGSGPGGEWGGYMNGSGVDGAMVCATDGREGARVRRSAPPLGLPTTCPDPPNLTVLVDWERVLARDGTPNCEKRARAAESTRPVLLVVGERAVVEGRHRCRSSTP